VKRVLGRGQAKNPPGEFSVVEEKKGGCENKKNWGVRGKVLPGKKRLIGPEVTTGEWGLRHFEGLGSEKGEKKSR